MNDRPKGSHLQRRIILISSIISGTIIFSFIISVGLIIESSFTLYHLNQMACEKGEDIRKNFALKVQAFKRFIGLIEVERHFPKLVREISTLIMEFEEGLKKDPGGCPPPEKMIMSMIQIESSFDMLENEVKSTDLKEIMEYQLLMEETSDIERHHIVLRSEFLTISERYNRKARGIFGRFSKWLIDLPDYLPSGDF